MKNRREKNGSSDRFYFHGIQEILQIVTATMKLQFPWKETYDKTTQHIKKQRHHFADIGPYSQSYVFSNSHVQM